LTDNRFEEMYPEHTKWWAAHIAEDATVVLRCGHDGYCGDRVGEIKTDGDTTLVLINSRFPEATIPLVPEAALTEDELQRRIAARDAQTISYTDDGRRVARRHTHPASVMPLELLPFIVCPTHGVLPVSKEIVVDLQQFVTDTQRGTERKYFVFHGK
jgi:hypothetical protein